VLLGGGSYVSNAGFSSEPAPPEGIGCQIVDREHNAPASGPDRAEVDFKSAHAGARSVARRDGQVSRSAKRIWRMSLRSPNVERVLRSVEGSIDPESRAVNFHILPELYHEDMEFREASEWPNAGVHRGLHAYEAYWRQFVREIDAERSEVEQAFDGGDLVLAYIRSIGRDAKTGEPLELRYAGIFTFRGDKIARVEGFQDRAQALEIWRAATRDR
jgi:ketosteroid isomerase-like protein